ncbi:MAG: TrkA C-terminal domain-containing protein [Terriglobia bacterium]
MDIETAEVHVAERSSLVGKPLSDSAVRQAARVMILAMRRAAGGHFEVNPAPETRIGAGDYLIAIGSPDHIKKLESLARA